MTDPDHTSLDSLTDPESLLARHGLAVETHTDSLAPEDFADAEAWDSHVAVGVADDRGVLCYDDGHHGWTLPAFAVADDEDYLAVARREFDALTGAPVAVEDVVYARRRVFTVAGADDDDDRETSVWNVIVRASPDDPLSNDPDCREDGSTLRWFDGVPEDAEGVVVEDVGRVAAAGQPSADPASGDPTRTLTDPSALCDRDGVEYVAVTDDEDLEAVRDRAGTAVLCVTNADGELALSSLHDVDFLPHALVEPGDDFVAVAHAAARELLGIDVVLDDVVRVRRTKAQTDGGTAEAYAVVFAAAPAGTGDLSDAEAATAERVTGASWVDAVPEDLPGDGMSKDARLFLD